MNTIKIVAAVAIGLSLAGCSGRDNFRDVENAGSKKADSYTVYSNVDANPNITVVCIKGVAFVTTTRDYNAIMRVDALDKTCPGYVAPVVPKE